MAYEERYLSRGKKLRYILRKTICHIWETKRMPEDWAVGIICLIHKKGDKTDCNNYRPITLLNVAYKIFSNTLYKRLLPYVDSKTGIYQCGFQQGKATTEQMFTLRQILQKCREYIIRTHYLSIDFKTGYDSIIRQQLYEAMKKLEIPSKLI
jgi:sorting nexin-29